MTIDQRRRCRKIIHSAAVSGAGVAAAMAQLPTSDNAALCAIEITMTISLGAVFGIEITRSVASGIAATTAGTLAGRAISQTLVGWIPGAGNVINAATAAAMIEALGWAIASDFERKTQILAA